TKGLRLAALIKQHNCLLVLDGVEPMQHPLTAPHIGGQLTDDSIRALLQELTRLDAKGSPDWQGLCVVTTRVPLTDIEGLPGTEQLVLENLDVGPAMDLLRHLIGTDGAVP